MLGLPRKGPRIRSARSTHEPAPENPRRAQGGVPLGNPSPTPRFGAAWGRCTPATRPSWPVVPGLPRARGPLGPQPGARSACGALPRAHLHSSARRRSRLPLQEPPRQRCAGLRERRPHPDPYGYRRHVHARHHATRDNLDKRRVGGIYAMTAEEYLAATPRRRFSYRAYHSLFMMFLFGPVWVFMLGYRPPPRLRQRPAQGARQRRVDQPGTRRLRLEDLPARLPARAALRRDDRHLPLLCAAPARRRPLGTQPFAGGTRRRRWRAAPTPSCRLCCSGLPETPGCATFTTPPPKIPNRRLLEAHDRVALLQVAPRSRSPTPPRLPSPICTSTTRRRIGSLVFATWRRGCAPGPASAPPEPIQRPKTALSGGFWDGKAHALPSADASPGAYLHVVVYC